MLGECFGNLASRMGTIWAIMRTSGTLREAERFAEVLKRPEKGEVEIIYFDSDELSGVPVKEVMRRLLEQKVKTVRKKRR
jgi:hypothetical protein